MRIDYKISENDYEDLNRARRHGQFLQSWAWGEFQREFGSVPIRYALRDIERETAITLFRKPLLLGRHYLYAPRIGLEGLDGPAAERILEESIAIARREHCIFIRFEPCSALPPSFAARCRRTLDVQPSQTLIIDLERTDGELLRVMHPKTRYNLKVAERHAVAVRPGTAEDFEDFWTIMAETKERDGFRLHSREYYRRMLALPFVKLLIAEYEGRLVAGNIVACYGDLATYIHGASANADRNIMAPYALQWRTIALARENGCRYYDLYGIDEHKWPGVTRFKLGFGGARLSYPGAHDLAISGPAYLAYRLLRRLRRSL